MTMDAVTIETLPTTKSLLSTKVPESTDIAKEKDDDILFIDEIDEDDEIRLRLSDDEEVEQENTLEHTENQEASLQLKKDDLEFDVHVAVTPKEATKSHQELIIRQDLPETNTVTLIKNQNIQNSSKKKFSNESCNVNDEESTMSGSEKAPPLTQNSRKFWSNNFDKRWKGINSPRGRQNFSHRNSNDWYNQQYQEKDKFNNRNNFNHHNNHFNKLRHNIRGNYNNKSGGNRNKDIQKDKAEESLKSKHNIHTLENTNDKKHSIQENGISNNAQSKKNDLSIQNSSMKMNDKESKVAETDLNSKKNAQNSNEDESCNVETHKENDNNSNIGILVDNEMKNNENTMDNILNDNENLSVTKDCDVSMIECEKENCESKSEEIKKRKANKCNSDMADKTTNSNTNSASNDVELESKQNSVEKNSELSSDIQIMKISSHDENLLENKSEIEMEIDNSNEDLCSHTDKDSNSDQIRECDNAKDIVLELSENNNKSLSEKFDAEQQADNINVFNDKKSSEAVETNENTNHSLDDKSISQMETSEIEQTDSKESQTTNSEEDSKILNENIETESSSILISCIDVKDSDANDIDKNEKNNEEICLLENDKINSDVKKETEAGKIKEISKQSKDAATVTEGEEKLNSTMSNEQEKISGPIEEVDLVDDESEMAVAVISNDIQSDTLKNKDDVTSTTTTVNKDTSQIVPISNEDGNKVEESNKDGRAVVHKRRRRKRLSNVAYLEIASNEIQTDEFFNSVKMLIENGVRQKRRSARNAEEMIRKEILKNDEDDEDSSDESGKLVPVNYKKPNYTQSLSPPSLKRTLDDADCISESVTLKRIKSSGDNSSTTIPQSNENKEYVTKSKESIAKTNELVRQISQEDIRGKLKKLKQEELEALLLQKIVECITIRGEMGKLREQARVSKRNQEATRTKCQQLQKQVEGFDMVLKRISFDKNSNNDKYAPPIKINRSVGLQVNFLSDHGIHNLKQIQAMKTSAGNTSTAVTAKTTLTTTTPSTATMTTAQDNRSLTQSPRKMLKVRSPRRPETSSPAVAPSSPGSATNSTANSNNTTSTTLVMSKPMDQSPKRTITLQNSNNNIVQLMPAGQQQQAVVVNSNIAGSTTRTTTSLSVQRPNNTVANKASDLIDLTDEEDKSKTSVISPITTGITTRFPRVLQAVPASVALNNQANLRLVQGGNQASQTAIVNNINTPRLAYVMQSGVPTRQLVLTNSNTIRPVTTVSTRNISTISYKQGVPTLTNGTVRVLTAQNPTTNLQHPAPLPESSVPESNPSWKSPPPAPSLKISKVATGIVLSWNMSLSDKFAEIVSYQLYAYQEVAGTSPSASLWKKVGDVRALPLPMACTLTQFTEGNNYYFAVRAVDIHSRFGQYSKPGNISL